MSLRGLSDGKMIILQIALVVFIASIATGQRRGSQRRRNQISRDVTFTELRNLGARCHPRDTCSVLREADNITKAAFCQCGSVCSKLNTCCLDSKYRHVRPDNTETPHTCMAEYRNPGMLYFMINRCKRGWNGASFVKDLCLGDAEKLSDPVVLTPVVNIRKVRTYKNIYCAACNDETTAGLTFWNLRAYHDDVEGNTLTKLSRSQLKALRFNPRKQLKSKTRSFVSPEWELSGDGTGKLVRLQLEIPPSVFPYIQPCRDMISTCARSWKDDAVSRKCASYMAHVVIAEEPYKRYRNVHCAICNFRNIDKLKCLIVNPADPGSAPKRPFSFGRLLDISFTGGDVVGRKRKCKEIELFHPVKEVCVPLGGCFVGHVFKDGQCVRRSG